jgi:glucokinase
VRALGIDVGGSNIKAVLLERGEVVSRSESPTLSERGGPDAVLGRIAAVAREAAPWDSIGVALPGLFDPDGRATLLPNLHGDWVGVAIADPLAAALDRPVRLVNDGHAFALAESTLGAGSGGRNVMCVVCGTGIGGGLVLDGELHLGPRQRAGEFGHHTVVENGPECNCGNRGCLELYAGSRAIARAAGAESFREAVGAAESGDRRAREAIARAGQLIGLAIANILIFLCPDRVVVGGGVAAAGDVLLDPLRAEIERRARVAPLELIEIAPARLGAQAGAIGAALWGATTSAEGRA